VRWRSDLDRPIAALAVPALGALVAEPLYVLADTAIVGHLGTRPLAGLAVAGIVLTAAFSLCNFLAYATTGAVARRTGAGQHREAVAIGIDGAWLAAGIGVVLAALGVVGAPWIVDAMGASARVHPDAVTYLRIGALGAPAFLVMFAGTGFLRGRLDTRTTLVIAVAANVVNLVLEVVLVYGFRLGIAGSAWGTVVAQVLAGAVYVAILRRAARSTGATVRPDRRGIATVARVGAPLAVRTGSLLAVSVTTTALAARIGDVAVAAHQIAFQVNLLLALVLDALAIAGQALVGRALGADDAPAARSVERRLVALGVVLGLGLAVVLAATAPWFPAVFTGSPGVRHLTTQVLWIVAAMQPLAAVVFVLDGVLIGAGDQRYLAWAMVVASFGVFAPVAAGVTVAGGGLLALWGAIAAWLVARGVGMVGRARTDRWLVTGAVRS